MDNACLINFRVGRDPTVGGVDDLNLPAGMGDSDARPIFYLRSTAVNPARTLKDRDRMQADSVIR